MLKSQSSGQILKEIKSLKCGVICRAVTRIGGINKEIRHLAVKQDEVHVRY